MISVEKVRKEILEKFDCVLVSTEIPNSNCEIEFICNKHKDAGVQRTRYLNIWKGNICHECGKEHIRDAHTLSNEEIIKLTNDAGFEYIGHYYKNGKCCIQYICPYHRDIGVQEKSLSSIRKKQKCPYCVNKNATTESFKKRVYEINPNIEIIGEYITMHDHIKCKCKIDGYEWEPIAQMLIRGEGCPICGRISSDKSRAHTKEWFEEKMKELHPDIEYGEYTRMKNSVHCKCKVCGFEWDTTPDSLINNNSHCPKCVGKQTSDRCRKTHEQFLKELKEVNPNIIPLEKYIDAKTKILCKCTIHNYIWKATPNKLLIRMTGCPMCQATHNENKICKILSKWGYNFVTQYRFDDCKDKNTLPFDVYIPSFNILIEYDGEQHYYPINFNGVSKEKALESYQRTIKHDKIKDDYCKSHNIPLIRIPYWMRDELEYFLFDELVKNKAIQLI